MAISFASVLDPYILPDRAFSIPANYNVLGKPTRGDPRLIAGERTSIFIVAGQSNGANTGDTIYSPVNAGKVDNLNVQNGGLYAAIDPLLGCTNAVSGLAFGNLFTRLADKLIAAGTYDRVILAPVALGGASIGDWSNNVYDRINVAYRRAAALGYPTTAVLWQQGEADGPIGTTQSEYVERFHLLRSKMDAGLAGVPWILAKSTYIAGVAYPAIRSAIDELVNGSTLFAGPDTDTLTGTAVNRQADGTHFKAAGADAAADLWIASIDAAL